MIPSAWQMTDVWLYNINIYNKKTSIKYIKGLCSRQWRLKCCGLRLLMLNTFWRLHCLTSLSPHIMQSGLGAPEAINPFFISWSYLLNFFLWTCRLLFQFPPPQALFPRPSRKALQRCWSAHSPSSLWSSFCSHMWHVPIGRISQNHFSK